MSEQGYREVGTFDFLKFGLILVLIACAVALVIACCICGSEMDEKRSASKADGSLSCGLCKADRIIDEYIDLELAPRLMVKGATMTEIQDVKKQLIEKFREVPESERVASAKYAIHEMIRMNGL